MDSCCGEGASIRNILHQVDVQSRTPLLPLFFDLRLEHSISTSVRRGTGQVQVGSGALARTGRRVHSDALFRDPRDGSGLDHNSRLHPKQ